jgi:hypothetical protein
MYPNSAAMTNQSTLPGKAMNKLMFPRKHFSSLWGRYRHKMTQCSERIMKEGKDNGDEVETGNE